MQEEAINAVMSNRDVFVCMPTGGGKSLIYQLPSLLGAGVTLVFMPLLSLIRDQSQKVKSANIKQCMFVTGMSDREKADNYDLFESDPDVSLVFLTPEKLAKSQRTQSIVEKLHTQNRLARIVIDEAHCVSKWGHSFREDYLSLGKLRVAYPDVPILAMTATATELVKADVEAILGMRDTVEFRTSCNRPNLVYSVRKKSSEVMREIGAYILINHPNHTGLIYCLSVKDTERVAAELRCVYKVNIECYHGQMDQKDRVKAEKRWKSGEVKVLASTIAFGMGIDKPDVRFVIHHSIPMSIDNYMQESGRAGRDSHPSDCILYYSACDISRNRFLLQSARENDNSYGSQLSLLEAMVDYCEEQVECRRSMLMKAFGEKMTEGRCAGRCDNCCSVPETTTKDFTSPALSILQLITTITTVSIPDLISKMGKIPSPTPSISTACTELQTLSKYQFETLFRKLISSSIIQFSGTKHSTAIVPGPNSDSLLTGKDTVVIAFATVTLEEKNAPLHYKSSLTRARKRPSAPQLSPASKQKLREALLSLRAKMLSKNRKRNGNLPTFSEIDDICDRVPMSLREAREIGLDLNMRFVREIRVFVKENRMKAGKQRENAIELEEIDGAEKILSD